MRGNKSRKSIKKLDFNALKPLAMLTHFGLIIIIPLIAGVTIGAWIDGKFGTGPVFLIIFLILFLISAMTNVYNTAMKLAEKEKTIKKDTLTKKDELHKKQEFAENNERERTDYDRRD